MTAAASISAAPRSSTSLAAAPAPAPDPRAVCAGPCEPVAISAHPEFDALFRDGPDVPHLDTHTPQGMSVWPNYDLAGTDLILIGAYRDGAPSYLIGLDPADGRHVGTVQVSESHLGGVAVVGQWLFTTGSDTTTVRRYRVLALREAIARSAATGVPAPLEQGGEVQRVVGAHFMTVAAGRLWTGRYSRDPSNSYMAEYAVGAGGLLTRVGPTVMLPVQTQGALVSDAEFVLYSGLREGRITVLDRAATPGSLRRVIAAPAFGQNLARLGDTVVLLFEGASFKFSADPGNAVPIRRLQLTEYPALTR
ncbi:MAG: hypothetical protein ACT4PP_09555 [Sporichthyaceae bacterium]